MKKSTALAIGVCLLLIPATVLFGMELTGKSYYLISTLILLETMLPMFLVFESRKPQARELVLIAVLCAISVVSRVAFLLPHFKPVFAIIMLTGMVMGAEAGFMTGAMSALASNFFYSQGPWTPWQMLSYGLCGLIFGILFHNRPQPSRWLLAILGFFTVVIIAGPVLDCSTLFISSRNPSWNYAAMVFAAGFPNNVSNGIATALTLGLFGKPLQTKLNRMLKKYGLMDQSHSL